MKREEYMGALQSALAGFDEELVQEIVSDYEERFRVGLEKGKTEEKEHKSSIMMLPGFRPIYHCP